MSDKKEGYENGMVQELVEACDISHRLAGMIVSKAVASGFFLGFDQATNQFDDLKEIELELKKILKNKKISVCGEVLGQEFEYRMHPKIRIEWEAVKNTEKHAQIEYFAKRIANRIDREATIKYLEKLIEVKKGQKMKTIKVLFRSAFHDRTAFVSVKNVYAASPGGEVISDLSHDAYYLGDRYAKRKLKEIKDKVCGSDECRCTIVANRG